MALVSLAAAPGALGDTTWTKISRDGLGGIIEPEIALDGTRAVAAWALDDPSSPGASIDAIEAVSFDPSLTSDAVNAQGPAFTVSGFISLDRYFGLVPKAGGGLQLVVGGSRPGDPNNFVYLVPRNPDGSAGAPTAATALGAKWSAMGAAALPDGTPIFASSFAGGVYVARGVDPSQQGTDVQAGLGGCCGNVPSLSVDAAGRAWIAWYSNATGATGVYLQQLDPATGAPVGSPVKAPQSESGSNNFYRVPLACAATCRTVYRIDGSRGGPLNRIVTWAPGEAAPTQISTSDDGSLGFKGAAAYRADGRLWVVWYDDGGLVLGGKGRYRVTLGEARGAGGIVADAGQPSQLAASGGIRALPAGDNLVIAANVTNQDTAKGAAIWTNVVAPPSAIPAPGPAEVDLEAQGQRFYIRVQYRVRIACSNPCPARAEIRTRTGGRVFTAKVQPLPGDGKVVLGTRRGLKLATGKRVYFDIPVNKTALLKAPFKTARGYRIAETRMRVWLKTPGGEVLTVRDGRIRVSIARIKSGALPGLGGIL